MDRTESRRLGTDSLTLRRSLPARLAVILLLALGAGLFAYALTTDCSRWWSNVECLVVQGSAPVVLVLLSVCGLVVLVGLFDRRPHAQLDARGIRFRWIGFIAWTEVEAAVVPRRRGSAFWVELRLRDRQGSIATRRRSGPVFRRIAFATYGNPLGRLLIGDLCAISLFGTGFRSKEIADWINRRIEATGSAANADSGSGPQTDAAPGAA